MVIIEAERIGVADWVVKLRNARAGFALEVVVISQCACACNELGIDLSLHCEVARGTLSSIGTGVGGVFDVAVVFCSPSANEGNAVKEHVFGVSRCAAPVVVAINGSQGCATLEHVMNVYRCMYVERRDVEHLQGRTVGEHIAHVIYVLSIERAEVERLQRRASTEHAIHCCHVLRVERAEVERLQRGASTEHLIHICHD